MLAPIADSNIDWLDDDDDEMDPTAADEEVPEEWCNEWWNKKFGKKNDHYAPKKTFKEALEILLRCREGNRDSDKDLYE